MVESPIIYINSSFVNWKKGGYFSPGEAGPQILLRRGDSFVLYTDDLSIII